MITAKALGLNLPISTKQSVEICSFIRNKTTDKAKILLQEVMDEKKPVPFMRFNRDVGHKKGKIRSGRFPVKSCSEFLRLVKAVEANALNRGLSSLLLIKEIKANKSSKTWHYGRQRRTRMKRTNIEIVICESESKVKAPEKPKTTEKIVEKQNY